MINKLKQLAWHDSEIQSIFLDRSNPGRIDELLIKILSPQDKTYNVLFKNCYKVLMNLNMGVVSSENIFDVSYEDKDKKEGLLRNLAVMKLDETDLKYFRIETGSTGSVIELFYMDVEVTESDTHNVDE